MGITYVMSLPYDVLLHPKTWIDTICGLHNNTTTTYSRISEYSELDHVYNIIKSYTEYYTNTYICVSDKFRNHNTTYIIHIIYLLF